MAIRPIDLQLLVHKTAEVNRFEQGEGRRPEVAHQQFSDIIQKQTEEEARQVLHLQKTEQEEVDKDGSGKGKYERKGKNKGKKEENKDTPRKSGSTSTPDVMV